MSGFGFSRKLLTALWQQGKSPKDDPVLLAKLIEADGRVIYLIDIHAESSCLALTYFDPSFPLGYPVIGLIQLDDASRLCPNFEPKPVSQFDPEFLS